MKQMVYFSEMFVRFEVINKILKYQFKIQVGLYGINLIQLMKRQHIAIYISNPIWHALKPQVEEHSKHECLL